MFQFATFASQLQVASFCIIIISGARAPCITPLPVLVLKVEKVRAKIGELANMLACSDATIRYYERKGLLPRPARSANNYRVYDDSDLERMRFIINCRKHGLSLAEIKTLLAFRENPDQECGMAHKIVDKHLEAIDKQINSLKSLKEDLEALGKTGACEKKGQCIILEHFRATGNCSCCNGGVPKKP